MMLYEFGAAANSKRVSIFLAEKGLDIPSVEPNLRQGALHEEPLRSMNPFSAVPFLELDDGTVIAESIAICRYLEELHPDPSLLGRDAKERAVVEMWNRRVEIDGFVPAIHALRNGDNLYAGRVLPGTKNDLPAMPEIVERGKDSLAILLGRMDAQGTFVHHRATRPMWPAVRSPCPMMIWMSWSTARISRWKLRRRAITARRSAWRTA